MLEVQYLVDNIPYQVWVPMRRIHPYTRWITSRILKLGSTIDCWYDPVNPNHIALQQGYHWLQLSLLIEASIVLFTFLLFYTIGDIDLSANARTSVNGSFTIKESLFLIQYIYQGAEPLSKEMLPEKWNKSSPQVKSYLVNRFNSQRKITGLKQPFASFLIMIFFIAGMIMIASLFYWILI